jgi:hypothetical protein
MNIFNTINYHSNNSAIQIKVDVRKHLPLFILMNNIHTACYYNYTANLESTEIRSLKNYHDIIVRKYPSITYQQFIKDPIFNTVIIFNRDGYVYKRDIKKLLFYKSLKSLGRQGSYLTGLGSLINNWNANEPVFVFTLCVKKGYEKYVQLCLTLNQEFEFDCLYFIYTKNTLTKHFRSTDRILLKEMLLYCKNYKIDVLELETENINRELEHDFKNEFSKLTNIKSLKDKLNNIHLTIISNVFK